MTLQGQRSPLSAPSDVNGFTLNYIYGSVDAALTRMTCFSLHLQRLTICNGLFDAYPSSGRAANSLY